VTRKGLRRGHLVREKNAVLVTMEVVIEQLEGVQMAKKFAQNSETSLFFA
jgi:predicted DNA-binding protein with PD1-like motif